jgi:chromosome segregation ATPase
MEELQQKQDEIDVLKSHLEREKEKLHVYEKRVADLTEELAITQANLQQAMSRLNQVSAERDNYQTKLKDSINKMSQYRDLI